jgi:hypothetical protein
MIDSPETTADETWKPSGKEGILFPVGLFKFAIMSVTTMGIYQGYWMYRNWKYLRQRRKVKNRADRRSDFPLIFIYPLFREIRAVGKALRTEPAIAPGALFIFWLALTFLANLPDPYCLLGNLDIIPMLIVQKYILKINCDHGCERFIDNKLTAKNWLAMVAGIAGNAAILIISARLG